MADPSAADPSPNPPVEETAAIGETTPAEGAQAATVDATGQVAVAEAQSPRISEKDTAATRIDLSHLPAQTRSLLRIRVPITVTLASQRRPIQEIMELGLGTLVKFEKTYDEPLELAVGELAVARGEVVKVGDKFGLRIRQLIRPQQRLASIGAAASD
jgi:flagellar motor switch protein FliN/FliY